MATYTFSSLVEARNPIGLKIFLDAGYIPKHIDYFAVLVNYDHNVEECKEIIRVIGAHPTTQLPYFKHLINFALFHIFSTFMEGVERIESDIEFNQFIYEAIPHMKSGTRQFILGNHDAGNDVSFDDYPIVDLVDRLLKSERADLSNPPEVTLDYILNENELFVYNIYCRAKFNPMKYDIRPLVHASNQPILNYLLKVMDINTQNSSGETALIYMSKHYNRYNSKQIQQLLLSDADPSIKDKQGHDAKYYLANKST